MRKSFCHLDLPFTMQNVSNQFLPPVLSVPAFISLILQALTFQHPHPHEQAVSCEIKENVSHDLEPRPRLQG